MAAKAKKMKLFTWVCILLLGLVIAFVGVKAYQMSMAQNAKQPAAQSSTHKTAQLKTTTTSSQ